MSLSDRIRELSQIYFDEAVGWRRHLHANPELAFEENETAKFISGVLDDIGIPHKTGIAKTGIVAELKGKDPEARVLALRADMDALPIQEENDISYKSRNEGKMHACGHDVHTASLLGAAKILKHLENEWNGTIKLIFQPSEEKLPGGASVMIREGVLENPNVAAIWGQHVHPPLEAGTIGIKPGPYMASADEVYITVKGKGGHAALPHELVDPVVMAAQVILGLQQVISRKANPATPSVLSFGKIEAKGATNVIPDIVKIEGTFRTFDEKWRREAHTLIETMARDICQSMGGDCEANVKVGYPYVNNDPDLTVITKNKAIEYLGPDKVIDLPIRMTGEDFAFYSQVTASCFYRLGTGNKAKGITSPIHTSTFNVDETSLLTGMGLMAYLAMD